MAARRAGIAAAVGVSGLLVAGIGRRWLRAGFFTVVVGDKLAPAAHTFEVAGGEVLLDDTARLY